MVGNGKQRATVLIYSPDTLIFVHRVIELDSTAMREPTTSKVLYKILTPQEKADMPATNWAGTALDVSRS